MKLPQGTHAEVELKINDKLIIFDCQITTEVLSQQTADYFTEPQFTVYDELEITKLEVTDLDYNPIEITSDEKQYYIKQISNQITIE